MLTRKDQEKKGLKLAASQLWSVDSTLFCAWTTCDHLYLYFLGGKEKKRPLFLPPQKQLKTPQTTKSPHRRPHRSNLILSLTPLLPLSQCLSSSVASLVALGVSSVRQASCSQGPQPACKLHSGACPWLRELCYRAHPRQPTQPWPRKLLAELSLAAIATQALLQSSAMDARRRSGRKKGRKVKDKDGEGRTGDIILAMKKKKEERGTCEFSVSFMFREREIEGGGPAN